MIPEAHLKAMKQSPSIKIQLLSKFTLYVGNESEIGSGANWNLCRWEIYGPSSLIDGELVCYNYKYIRFFDRKQKHRPPVNYCTSNPNFGFLSVTHTISLPVMWFFTSRKKMLGMQYTLSTKARSNQPGLLKVTSSANPAKSKAILFMTAWKPRVLRGDVSHLCALVMTLFRTLTRSYRLSGKAARNDITGSEKSPKLYPAKTLQGNVLWLRYTLRGLLLPDIGVLRKY